MEFAEVSHDISPDTKRYKKSFPTLFGLTQIVLAELLLLLVIIVAITDTQLNLEFKIREYAIMCAGWPVRFFFFQSN